MSRAPESNVQVFNLGHYETLQIDLALQVLRDALNSDGSFTFRADDLADLDARQFARLEPIFAAHGTITIIRTNDKE